MTRIKAFFTALGVLLLVMLGVHFYAEAKMKEPDSAMYTWTSEFKYKAGNIMKEYMDEDTVLVMGSSELQHQKKTPYNPASVFAGQKTKVMMVGAGYYQSLFHATLVSAMEQDMENRRAVLILAPQWFRKSGVKAEAYASRFSEENFVLMLQNPHVTDETKQYIMDRTKKLLKGDPQTLKRVEEYEEVYLGANAGKEKTGNASEKISAGVRKWFMDEKDMTNIALRLTARNISGPDVPEAGSASTEPDFEGLREQAAVDGEEACGGNSFYVTKKYYNGYIVKVMDDAKDEGINTGYSVSPEYDDLECFLKVCNEVGIKPLIVITPVNGYWYDWIGFDADAREDYYNQIRALAKKYDAETADFSDREYEEYFMEDTIHIGWKGWVDVNEAIYRYAEG